MWSTGKGISYYFYVQPQLNGDDGGMGHLELIFKLSFSFRLREERGDDRSIALDQKTRDLSPVLNLSKSGHGDPEAASLDGDARSEHSDEDEVNSTAASIRDDEENHHHDENVSDVDDRADKEDGKWTEIYCVCSNGEQEW